MATAYEKVQLARGKGRPSGLSFIQNIFPDFIELHGDRRFADDPAVIGGIATLGGRAVTVIAIEKGADTKDKVYRNFGSPNPEGYRKALRLMKQAEKFHRPVICFVDTSGAFCGIGAEERGQGQAIAENLVEMIGLKTPVISILVGEGGSGGALALAVADRVWILENAVYSVVSPEGCASILWKDAKKAKEAAECLHLTAQDMEKLGVVERVISESGKTKAELFSRVKEMLAVQTDELCKKDTETLLKERYERFRKYYNAKKLRPTKTLWFSPVFSCSEKSVVLGTHRIIPQTHASRFPARTVCCRDRRSSLCFEAALRACPAR